MYKAHCDSGFIQLIHTGKPYTGELDGEWLILSLSLSKLNSISSVYNLLQFKKMKFTLKER